MFVELDAAIAEAILRKIRREQDAYNEDWAWWRNDAIPNSAYEVSAKITVSVIDRGTKYSENSYGDQEPVSTLVFQFTETGTLDSVFFKISGVFNSYGDYDSYGQLVQVEPTTRTVVVYDFI